MYPNVPECTPDFCANVPALLVKMRMGIPLFPYRRRTPVAYFNSKRHFATADYHTENINDSVENKNRMVKHLLTTSLNKNKTTTRTVTTTAAATATTTTPET